MRLLKQVRLNRVLFVLGLATMSAGYTTRDLVGASATAQATVKSDASPPGTIDAEDRVAMLWYAQRLAKNGAQRGMEIYYMRCYMCHNEYTRMAEGATAAPSLRDLYRRPKLMVTGEAVSDRTVAAQIRKGSARMPAYSSVYLSDQDITDLLAYLRDKCCYDENEPPPNPRYRAQ